MRYLQEAKKDNFNGAMEALGIEISEKGLMELIGNMKQEEAWLDEVER